MACNDPNIDIEKVITDGGFGFWCEINDVDAFKQIVDEVCLYKDLNNMGNLAHQFLCNHYLVQKSYSIITDNLM